MEPPDGAAQPARAPSGGAGGANTMFLALHGALAWHPGQDPSVAAADAYSLFYARSSAMGWLREAVEGAVGGVWGMNDAEQDTEPGTPPARVAWFQVSTIGPVPATRPLPVQPFLRCAGDVVTRIGTFDLQALQILLPVQGLDGSQRASSPRSALSSLSSDTGWFADAGPRSRARVQVTVDGGQDPTLRSIAHEVLEWMRPIRTDVFVCDSLSVATDDAVVLRPGADGLWVSPGDHQATFGGTLAEWSLDALGWLAAFLVEAAYQHGVRTPLMLSARRG